MQLFIVFEERWDPTVTEFCGVFSTFDKAKDEAKRLAAAAPDNYNVYTVVEFSRDSPVVCESPPLYACCKKQFNGPVNRNRVDPTVEQI